MNRAVQWEGGLYYQVFCGGPGVHDGGLEDITVPYSLSHCEKFPEKREDGFFWLSAEDMGVKMESQWKVYPVYPQINMAIPIGENR